MKKTHLGKMRKVFSLLFIVSLIASNSFLVFNNVAFADTNIIPNPSLENASGGLPVNWHQGGWGTNLASFQYPVEGSEGAGSKAAKITISSYTDGDQKWYFDNVAVAPGSFYVFSDKYASTTTTQVLVQYLHTDTTFSYDLLGTPISSGGNWQTFTAGFNVPIDVNSLTVFHLINAVGSLTTDDYSLTTSTNPNEFSKGMVTLTFDDGWQTDFDNAKPILDAAGFKSTHYVLSQYLASDTPGYMTLAQVLQMQSQGYDISSHTRTHANLVDPATDVQTEVAVSRTELLANFSPVDSLAYPYGQYNANVKNIARNAGYSGARTVDHGFNDKSTDRFALKVQIIERGGLCDGDNAVPTTLPQVKNWIDTAAVTKTWLILVLHQTDDVTANCYGDSPAMLQSIVDYLKTSNVNVVTTSQALSLMRGQTITFGTLANKTYGDSNFTVSATASSGLPVTFTASGSCSINANTVHITGIGSCTITAQQAGNSNYNAAPNVPQTFTISKRDLHVSATGINKVFDGTTNASVVISTDAVSGDTITTPAVTAAFDDAAVGSNKPVHVTGITIEGASAANYNLANTTAETTANITLQNATITLDKTNLTRPYNGAAQSVAVLSTSPANLSYTVTYNGSATAPTAVNSYVVVATITDANSSGSDSATLIITKADQTITFGALGAKVFGDPDFTVSAAASSGLEVTFTATGACTIATNTVHLTTAGNCTITASQTGNDNYSAAPDALQTIGISDTVAPVIKLNGETSIDITVGGTYTEQNATATDNVDGNDFVTVGGDTVNTAVAAIYHVKYNAVDAAGNHAIEVVRTVNVNVGPTSGGVPVGSTGGGGSVSVPAGGGGGGGGGGAGLLAFAASSSLTGDINADGKIDLIDFNLLMANWGTPTNTHADLNKDGKVDIIDFNLLMINWVI